MILKQGELRPVKPTRTAALLVVLMLASTAPVSAECAWVLWVVTAKSAPGSQGEVLRSWQAIRGTDKRQDCETLASEYQSKASKNTMYSCLPDTIDPRKPKGSGR
jgi:hypothetical protein